MTAEQSSERPRVGRDFRLRVVWNGLEDKPFYKAVLLSASRASEAGQQPFWGYAVVSADESAARWMRPRPAERRGNPAPTPARNRSLADLEPSPAPGMRRSASSRRRWRG